MDKKLDKQVAVITGASSGIGAGCAKAFAEAGATVIVNYPRASSKSKTDIIVNDINSNGGKAVGYQCDVSKEDEVIKMFADIVSQFGTVDILINNAGLQKDASVRFSLSAALHEKPVDIDGVARRIKQLDSESPATKCRTSR